MHDPAHRFALVLLVACGIFSVALVPWDAGFALALITTAVVLAREARQEARWQGVLPLRPEA